MICRLIALDLDGTLLNSKKMISPASVSALQSAQQVGVKIILATGRSHSEALPYYQQLQLTGPMICCNGSYLYHPRQRQYCVRCRLISTRWNGYDAGFHNRHYSHIFIRMMILFCRLAWYIARLRYCARLRNCPARIIAGL